MQKGDLDNVILYAEKSKELGLTNPNLYILLGKTYLRKKLLNEALENFEKAAMLKSADDSIHFMLGLLYTSTKQVDKAIVAYKNTLKLNPSHSKARQQLKKLQELQWPTRLPKR